MQRDDPSVPALVLSLVVAFVMPVVYLVVPFAAGVATHSGDGFIGAVVVLGFIGAATWIAALTFSIRTVTYAGRTSTSPSRGWLGVALCVFGLFTGAIGWIFGLLFGAGGGPH